MKLILAADPTPTWPDERLPATSSQARCSCELAETVSRNDLCDLSRSPASKAMPTHPAHRTWSDPQVV